MEKEKDYENDCVSNNQRQQFQPYEFQLSPVSAHPEFESEK
jgi:hypothetical protein